MPFADLTESKKAALWALLLATLPTLAINLNYLIAASEGYVPWCVPYWDSCTSISATGRHGTAFYFFKFTMLPIAGLYWLYWESAHRVLSAHGYRGGSIRILGRIAVFALIAYILALGAVGDSLQLTRRIGIIFYFTFTYLCQLLIIYRVNVMHMPISTGPWQLAMLLLILLIGLLTLVLDASLDNYDDMEDAFEWLIALLLHGNFLLAAAYWHRLDLAAGQQSR